LAKAISEPEKVKIPIIALIGISIEFWAFKIEHIAIKKADSPPRLFKAAIV
jgi:hypothetical protein